MFKVSSILTDTATSTRSLSPLTGLLLCQWYAGQSGVIPQVKQSLFQRINVMDPAAAHWEPA